LPRLRQSAASAHALADDLSVLIALALRGTVFISDPGRAVAGWLPPVDRVGDRFHILGRRRGGAVQRQGDPGADAGAAIQLTALLILGIFGLQGDGRPCC
jgi:hypothetical protein